MSSSGMDHQHAGTVDMRLDLNLHYNDIIQLELPGGTKICVRNNIAESTCFVLVEQGDWFEPELAFLRHYTRPGMRVMDIGANHGIYALTLASLVGTDGQVVAYEPGPVTAQLLRSSQFANGFSQLQIIEAGLSDQAGEGQLFEQGASDSFSLTKRGNDTGQTHSISLSTLDDEWEKHRHSEFDIVKLDVEFHEEAVINGGRKFLEATNALVIYEVACDEKRATKLASEFSAFGFSAFKYLPELNVLIPADFLEFSNHQVNYVGAKPSAIRALERQNLIVCDPAKAVVPDLSEAWPDDAVSQWRMIQKNDVPQPPESPENAAARTLLNLNSFIQDRAKPLDQRVAALSKAVALSQSQGRSTDPAKDLARLLTTIGVAQLANLRRMELVATEEALKILLAKGIAPSEPFATSLFPIPEAAGFDTVVWLKTQLLLNYVTICAHSLLYVDHRVLPHLEMFADHALYPRAMELRRQLMRMRLGLQQGLHENDKLCGNDVNGGFVNQPVAA